MPGHFSGLIRTYVIIINFQNRMKPPKCLNLFSTLTVEWQITGKARDAELSDGRLSNPCLNHHSCQSKSLRTVTVIIKLTCSGDLLCFPLVIPLALSLRLNFLVPSCVSHLWLVFSDQVYRPIDPQSPAVFTELGLRCTSLLIFSDRTSDSCS